MPQRSIALETALKEFEGEIVQATMGQSLRTFLEIGLVGKKQLTKKWYEKRLVQLEAYLGEEAAIGSVMDADLLAWYAQLENRQTRWGGESTHPTCSGGLSRAYLYSLVRACKFYFRWLNRRKIIAEDPAAGLELPELPRTGRRGIADRDAERILRLASSTGLGDGNQVRDAALLHFLEATGARLSGLVNLTLSDLNLEEADPICRRAVVREKFDEERMVFMTPGAYQALCAWILHRPAIEDEHVFLGRTNGGRWHALTSNGIYQVVKRYAKAANVKRSWNPHEWRHRFGRKLAERGTSLGIISQIMGHKDVSITVRFYGQFAQHELQQSYDRHMPDTE